VLLQTTIPGYRAPVVEGLRRHFGTDLVVITGREGFAPGLETTSDLTGIETVDNVFFGGRRLLWQRGTVLRLRSPETVVLELNPRILNVWAILVLRGLLRRRTVLYGHAWPRRGQDARTDRVRHVMRRLANEIVVYTSSQAAELSRRMPGHTIRAAPNALYPRRLAVTDAEHRSARTILYVGRLVDAKKPALLLDAFAGAADRLPADARLVLVGDGPLRAELDDRAVSLGIRARVDFTGHVDDFERLQALYADALVSVSPGYVGLSLTQSLWFGVPALIARDEPHAPEIEAARPGWNAAFFSSDAPAELSELLLDVFAHRDLWLARATEIAHECAGRYSLESMSDALIEALDR
jgi:glycosyltransferase involved in cell wall biosynthesis